MAYTEHTFLAQHNCRLNFRCPVAVVILLAFLLIACSANKEASSDKGKGGGPNQMPPPTVRTAIVQVRTVPAYGDFVGQSEAKETVNIVPRVTGFLEKILFREGAEVHRGDVLFEIEKASYINSASSAQAKLAQDEALLIKYQRDAARLGPLVKERAATQTDLDTAVSGAAQQSALMKSDQASIDTALLNLSYTTIVSPIDGVVGKLGVTRGNLVSSGQTTALATISSYNPIYISFSIPEATYLNVRKKHPDRGEPPPIPLDLLLANGQPFSYKGQFNFVDRTVDSQTGTLSVRAVFPNPNALLRPGQFARIRFVTEQRPGTVLVPKGAITEILNAKAVMVVDESNKAMQRTVTLDGDSGDEFIVHSGLKGGERVVIEGVQKVQPGSQVNPQASKQPHKKG